MDIQLIYITASDMVEAKAVSRALLEKRLVACVNLIDGMKAMYWWKGQIEEGQEVVIVGKTVAALVPDVIETVKAVHSYECPCVVSLPVSGGNSAFLNWIEDEVSKTV
jgi:periplasmic divalent cation tolerance protein